jgi:hypothetical protein
MKKILSVQEEAKEYLNALRVPVSTQEKWFQQFPLYQGKIPVADRVFWYGYSSPITRLILYPISETKWLVVTHSGKLKEATLHSITKDYNYSKFDKKNKKTIATLSAFLKKALPDNDYAEALFKQKQAERHLVYAHISPSGMYYVGITKQKPNQRWGNGKGYTAGKFGMAVEAYGWDNFQHIILEENIPGDQIRDREKYWIDYYNSRYLGYNTLGGNYKMPFFLQDREALFSPFCRRYIIKNWTGEWIDNKIREIYHTSQQASFLYYLYLEKFVHNLDVDSLISSHEKSLKQDVIEEIIQKAKNSYDWKDIEGFERTYNTARDYYEKYNKSLYKENTL